MEKTYKDHLFYNSNPTTFNNAKSLRAQLTKTEELLWGHLRSRQVNGRKFRRQHPIGPYIADFYCAAIKLAIEIDGGYHNSTEQQQYDKARTSFMNEAEITVIRFTNTDVIEDLPGVLLKIKTAAEY